MTSTATVPSTIQLRPSRLALLVITAVVLAAAVTWAVTVATYDTDTDDARSAPAPAASQQLTPQQITAAYAGVYGGRLASSVLHNLAEATVAAGISDSALDLVGTRVGSAIGGAGSFIPRQSATAVTTAPPAGPAVISATGAYVPPQGDPSITTGLAGAVGEIEAGAAFILPQG